MTHFSFTRRTYIKSSKTEIYKIIKIKYTVTGVHILRNAAGDGGQKLPKIAPRNTWMTKCGQAASGFTVASNISSAHRTQPIRRHFHTFKSSFILRPVKLRLILYIIIHSFAWIKTDPLNLNLVNDIWYHISTLLAFWKSSYNKCSYLTRTKPRIVLATDIGEFENLLE